MNTERDAILSAIKHVLDRACTEQTDGGFVPPLDPGLGYYLSPHTESWTRLVEAEADLLGEDRCARAEIRYEMWLKRSAGPGSGQAVPDKPADNHWILALGHRWATDGILAIRQDASSPPCRPRKRWVVAWPEHSDQLASLVPRRSECSSETPAGYVRPEGAEGDRFNAAAEDAEILWSPPRSGMPLVAAFRPGDNLPIAFSAPRLAEKQPRPPPTPIGSSRARSSAPRMAGASQRKTCCAFCLSSRASLVGFSR